VVDLTHVFAGPTAGRTLAEFGAEVVKIDNPRAGFILDHRHLNRAKRSLLLDLTKDRGQRVLHRLLSDADVLLHSFSSGAAERLGLAYDDLKARYPALVYAEISAYGGPGPWRHRRGYEPQAQAVTGIASAHAQEHEPRQFSFALNDYGTGILTAFAIQLALIAREADGRGQRVSTSLSQTATVHQALALADCANAAPSDRPEQASELHGLYRASDGWLYVEAHLREPSDLSSVAGLEGLPPIATPERERAVEERFASAPSATWAARLAEVGFGAHACVTVENLMKDPWVIAHGLSITRAHEDVGPVRTIGPSGRLSRTPVRAGDPARPPGADGPAVLEAVGLSSEVAALIDARVLVTDGVTA
jgi:crotonobetainyl-CoA:carnitine CoA-transferase CaiB-like acyl-CoA transferase